MRGVLLIVFLIWAKRLYAQTTNSLVLGKVRFTFITHELARMEYATDGKFIDNQILFAFNRSSLTNDFELPHDDKYYAISLGIILS